VRPDPEPTGEITVRRFLLAAIAVVAVVPTPTASAATCTGADTVPTAANVAQARAATLCLLNVERAQRNRRPLRSNAGLALAGKRHARDMVRRRYFAHSSRAGRTFDDRIRSAGYLRGARGATMGENLGWGSGELATPRAMVRGWMNSSGHRANILRPAFREVGIAVVTRTPGGVRGATYATEFGRRFG
jgi:uncharacterized protein YkwD